MFDLRNRSILITGGTGSFGKKCARILLDEYEPSRLILYSRDELKQHDMRVAGFDHPNLRYFIGDVRDADRLRRAMAGVEVVIHAAALKQVPACEDNPLEAIQTNVNGSQNVIEAALDNQVQRVLAMSTGKAVNPVSLYGATKLVAEKLFIQANAYHNGDFIRFSSVRYGNFAGSRGSVIPLFLEQRKSGRVTITDPRMTRFWITLEQGVRFFLSSIETMVGGEVFVPKIPSMKMTALASAIAPGCEIHQIGIRSGEKLHEILLSEDEARHSVELADRFVIFPVHPWWKGQTETAGKPLPEGFRYDSETNTQWLSESELLDMAGETEAAAASQ
ncbi:MAG: UDP-N-acetylglucosamine 4,6-dehydratase (inverting) [Terracidiphilus sp.]